MPKIIKNLRNQLIEETRKQIAERGYKNTTIRSVAEECNIGVGTVYNYFKSKEVLVASFVLEDWLVCVKSISDQPKEDRKAYLEFIHTSLNEFADKYSTLFSDKDAAVAFNAAFSQKHKLLRSQLAELILPIAEEKFTAEFIAEALLTWTMAGKSFNDIYSLLPEIIKK
jgi:AcrR family transcriptional regulator